jgi:hypothetical protein
MKTVYTLLLLSCSVLVFGQNENPYAVFGYEAPIMKEPIQIQDRIDQFVFINPDTTSSIGMLAIDMRNREMTFYDKKGVITKTEKINEYSLARWLSVDPKNQFASPYVGMGNNPVMGVDPDGQFVFTILAAIFAPPLLPAAIGADIGMWSGGSMANGTANPFKWDYSSGRTWGYMAGGAVVGGLSGGAANAVATSGIPFANTAAIATGSFLNSYGTYLYTGGQTDVSIGFGVASYNISQNEWGYLGKGGNSGLENLGYGLGALANVSDILTGFKPGNVELRTENDPGYTKGYDAAGNPIPHKDLIGHSQIMDATGKPIIDWGPAPGTGGVSGFGDWVAGTNSYEGGHPIPLSKMKWDPINVKGVNVSRMNSFSRSLSAGSGRYNLAMNSCVSMTSRALNMAGVFNVGVHPYILNAQMYLRSLGIRPSLFSYHLYGR